jgi:kynurenine formamidase
MLVSDTVTALLAALAGGEVEVVDLTQPLSETTPVIHLPEPFANTPGLKVHDISNYDDAGPMWKWRWLEIGEHVGTHFDAPIHWISGRDKADLAGVPATDLVGPAIVLDRVAETEADPDYVVTADELRAFQAEHGPFPQGGWLFLRTGWDTRADDAEAFLNAGSGMPRTPGFDAECARYIAEDTPLVGVGVGRHRRRRCRRVRPAVPGALLPPRCGQVRRHAARESREAADDRRARRRRADEARRRHRQSCPRARPGAEGVALGSEREAGLEIGPLVHPEGDQRLGRLDAVDLGEPVRDDVGELLVRRDADVRDEVDAAGDREDLGDARHRGDLLADGLDLPAGGVDEHHCADHGRKTIAVRAMTGPCPFARRGR